jgi:hypothetical protein
MEDAIPVMNSINAPLELCEQVKERFQQFLNGFVISESLEAEPSQSITHSQGSGAVAALMAGGDRSRATHQALGAGQQPGRALGPPQRPDAGANFSNGAWACRRPGGPAPALLRGAAGHHEGAGAQVPLRQL